VKLPVVARITAFVLAPMIGLAACSSSPGPAVPDGCPVSSLPPAPACDPDNTARVRGARPLLDLPHNSLSPASLTVESLTANGPLLGRLQTTALGPGFSGGAGALHKNEPHGAELMTYIAACALDPCDAVAIPPRPSSQPDRAQDRLDEVRATYPDGFHGELGLCGERYNLETAGSPETAWASAPPTAACLQRVSACVLARVNAVDKRVKISLRGDGMVLVPRVPVETTLRENHGTPIPSFKGCDEQCLWSSPLTRNCDWEPRYVGQCVRGRLASDQPGSAHGTVTVRLKDAPAGTRARIRVCPGIHGCDDRDGGPSLPPPAYSGAPLIAGLELDDQGTVTFPCPRNGPVVDPTGAPLPPEQIGDGDLTGYYSVMIGALPGETLPADLDVELVDPATATDAYPADEPHVFTYREGAFYGGLFGEPPRVVDCAESTMFAGDQYVCFSKMWSLGAAMAADRFCAGPDAPCFMNAPAGCDTTAAGQGVGVPTISSPVGGEVYESCAGNGQTWQQPYTTYLNHPCDLLDSVTACKGYLDPRLLIGLVDPPRPRT